MMNALFLGILMTDHTVTIDRLSSRGRGVSGSPGSVEVIGSLPGDHVRISLRKKRKGMSQGTLLEILTPSPSRVQARCSHSPFCGGCSLQQMAYKGQLRYKENKVKELLLPYLSDTTQFLPILPCEEPWSYRNKMEFSFSQNKAKEKFLGLILAGSKGHVFNLQECHLTSPWMAEIVKKTFAWWETTVLQAHKLDGSGTLRYLTLREGKRTGDKMVILTVSGNPAYPIHRTDLNTFIEAVCSVIGKENVSIFLRVQQAIKGMPTQFYEMHLFGKDHIEEELIVKGRSLRFKVSLSSFFQPNTFQAERLYTEALSLSTASKKCVLDLYAGTATLGIAFSLQAEKVIAIELCKEAVIDAKENCERNGIKNVEVIAGDVGKILLTLKEESPDLVVLDPPRIGLGEAVTSLLGSFKPKEILYISCNPASQAEDIKRLKVFGYELVAVRPVDQFPHTAHIENIVLLRASS